MKTWTLILMSCGLFAATAAAFSSWLGVGLSVGIHALLFSAHQIEIELNRLLDRAGITVFDHELDE